MSKSNLIKSRLQLQRNLFDLQGDLILIKKKGENWKRTLLMNGSIDSINARIDVLQNQIATLKL